MGHVRLDYLAETKPSRRGLRHSRMLARHSLTLAAHQCPLPIGNAHILVAESSARRVALWLQWSESRFD